MKRRMRGFFDPLTGLGIFLIFGAITLGTVNSERYAGDDQISSVNSPQTTSPCEYANTSTVC